MSGKSESSQGTMMEVFSAEEPMVKGEKSSLAAQRTTQDSRRLLRVVVGLFFFSLVVAAVILVSTGQFSKNNVIPAQSLNQTTTLRRPSSSPSSVPSQAPTHTPSIVPSASPTDSPSTSPTASPSGSPTRSPSGSPTSSPSHTPTTSPTESPSQSPTGSPSQSPTSSPTQDPTSGPTRGPTSSPTRVPSLMPTMAAEPPSSLSPTVTTALVDVQSPTRTSPAPSTVLLPLSTSVDDSNITYRPGDLVAQPDGLLLSRGLSARIIATKNRRVRFANGQVSDNVFHERPDFGATFPHENGGWIYVSNSEMRTRGMGGVGALVFDKDGQVLDYRLVLTNTTMNCGGGRTPWNTWISCEEVFENGEGAGEIYQVDPTGQRLGEPITMGRDGGRFESFTFDVRDKKEPKFYASEDRRRGPIRRWIPSNVIDWETASPSEAWDILNGEGSLDFLVLAQESEAGGTFHWTKDKFTAQINAVHNYPECEGVDIVDGKLYMVAKRIKVLFILDLDAMTYTRHTTQHGAFDGSPDQVASILKHDNEYFLYFTEEGGSDAGIHGRNSLGQYFTIMEGGPRYADESTGLAFSPNGIHLYVAFQEHGVVLDITRDDGRPFQAQTLNIKYHNTKTQ